LRADEGRDDLPGTEERGTDAPAALDGAERRRLGSDKRMVQYTAQEAVRAEPDTGAARQQRRRNRWCHGTSIDGMSTSTTSSLVGATGQPAASLVTWTQVIYGLHAFSIVTGIVGAATVVGSFLIGWPSVIAVILNYVKRGEACGTWLESHFRWQIRTFWFGLLWVSLCVIFIIVTLGLGALVAWIPMVGVGLWFIYRIVRGWLALAGRRPMYA
jgi:uncharacterized membrane protein